VGTEYGLLDLGGKAEPKKEGGSPPFQGKRKSVLSSTEEGPEFPGPESIQPISMPSPKRRNERRDAKYAGKKRERLLRRDESRKKRYLTMQWDGGEKNTKVGEAFYYICAKKKGKE